jgi:putative membrane protein
MMNGMMNGMGMMVWGVFSFLLGLVFIILFVVAVAALVKWIWGQKISWDWKNQESALDILKQRYAKGEISKEEFERIKRDIE